MSRCPARSPATWREAESWVSRPEISTGVAVPSLRWYSFSYGPKLSRCWSTRAAGVRNRASRGCEFMKVSSAVLAAVAGGSRQRIVDARNLADFMSTRQMPTVTARTASQTVSLSWTAAVRLQNLACVSPRSLVRKKIRLSTRIKSLRQQAEQCRASGRSKARDVLSA